MNEPQTRFDDEHIIELVAKIVLIGLLVYGSYLILQPFIGIIIWSIIIAVAINPLITLGEKRLGWSRTKVSVYFTVAVASLILIPAIGLAVSLSDTVQSTLISLKAGTLSVPHPSEKVATWPLIGKYIYPLWQEASVNLNVFVLAHKAEIMPYVKSVLAILGSGLITVFTFLASIIIAAFLTSTSHSCTAFTQTLATRIAGNRGIEWAFLSTMTIRSVVQGVIGIALIQATIGYIGFILFGIPLAVVLAFLILLIAIAQLPTILVLIIPMIYMFSTASTPAAIGFLVFSIILGLSDNVLKPLLLGRGVDAPMLVILLGAIGGMIIWGILGLFIGSVLLAVAYKLFTEWVNSEAQELGISAEEIARHDA
jgi:predicted PurR-regulated permease PerM